MKLDNIMASMWLNRHFDTLYKLVQTMEDGSIDQNYRGPLLLLAQQQVYVYTCEVTYDHS